MFCNQLALNLKTSNTIIYENYSWSVFEACRWLEYHGSLNRWLKFLPTPAHFDSSFEFESTKFYCIVIINRKKYWSENGTGFYSRKKTQSKINKVYTLNMGQNYAKKLWEKSISGCVFWLFELINFNSFIWSYITFCNWLITEWHLCNEQNVWRWSQAGFYIEFNAN